MIKCSDNIKTCNRCKITKTIDDFYSDKRTKDKKRVECKECSKDYVKNYRQTDKGKVCVKKYNQSNTNKKSYKKWHQSKKGKIARKRYQQSEKGKIANKRYHQTDKCKEIKKRIDNNRRNMGFIPLNNYIKDFDAHHLNNDYIIYMDHEIHNGIYHNHNEPNTMIIINKLALDFLYSNPTEINFKNLNEYLEVLK